MPEKWDLSKLDSWEPGRYPFLVESADPRTGRLEGVARHYEIPGQIGVLRELQGNGFGVWPIERGAVGEDGRIRPEAAAQNRVVITEMDLEGVRITGDGGPHGG